MTTDEWAAEIAELEDNLAELSDRTRREMAEVLLHRTLPMLRRIVEQVPTDILKAALEAPTDIGAMSRLLTTSAATESVRALDPLAEAFARGARQQEKLLERAGGTWGVTDVADHLRISRQAVDKRRRRGSLLAVELGDTYRYPMLQFSETGVKEALPEVLRAMEPASGWTKLSLLFSRPPKSKREETLLETVEGGDRDVALHAARSWGTQGAV